MYKNLIMELSEFIDKGLIWVKKEESFSEEQNFQNNFDRNFAYDLLCKIKGINPYL